MDYRKNLPRGNGHPGISDSRINLNTASNGQPIKFIVLLVFLAMAAGSQAQQKTITLVGNCQSVILNQVSGFVDALGPVTTSYTTYDGNTARFPLKDEVPVPGGMAVLFGGELRPRANAPGVYEADYASYN